jgi:GNAT superfamily N-acetyltransferase
MRRELVAALAREGLPIEAAARVLLAVFGPEALIDVAQFAPLQVGEYVIRAERFVEVLPELRPLHAAHWRETEKYRAGIAMDPDYEAMIERERIGRLLQIVARAPDGAIAGHVRMFLGHSLHTRTLYAEEDTLYVAPGHRGGPVAIRLMRYAEKCLLTLGVREIRANSKLSNHADVLMRRLGYPAVATQFCKVFGAQEAASPQEDAAHEPPT